MQKCRYRFLIYSGESFDLIPGQATEDKRDTSMLAEREMDVVIFLSGGGTSTQKPC